MGPCLRSPHLPPSLPPPPPTTLKAFKQQERQCLTQQRSVVLRAPAIPGNKADPRFIPETLPGDRTHSRQLIKQEESSTLGAAATLEDSTPPPPSPPQTKHNRRRQEVPRLGRSGPQKTRKRQTCVLLTRRRGAGPESRRTEQKGGESCCGMHANRRVIFRIRWMMLNSRFHNLMIAAIQMRNTLRLESDFKLQNQKPFQGAAAPMTPTPYVGKTGSSSNAVL